MLSHNNVVNNIVFFPIDAQHVPYPLQCQFKSLFPLLSCPYHLACVAASPRTCLNHLIICLRRRKLGSLRSNDADDNEERQKNNWFN